MHINHLDEALTHGGIKNNLKVNLVRIESDNLKVKDIKNKLTKCFRNSYSWGIWQKRYRGKNCCNKVTAREI